MRSSIQVLLLSFLFYGTFGEEADIKSSLDSILKAISSMNGTLVDNQRTMARFAKLEPIQRALAEEEKRRKLEQGEIRREFESYDFNTPSYKGGCYNLTKLKGKIKSVDTEGTCVRIFTNNNICASWSQALYPGSSVTIEDMLEGVGSIGPCVRNEFEYATLTMSGNPPVLTVNKRAKEVADFANVPDLVPDYWANPSKRNWINNTEPITHYKLGQGGRLEVLRSEIYARHILSPDVAEGNRIAGLNQSFLPELGMIPLKDEPGYVVPLELGGPAKEAYNVFAQDKGQAAEYRALLVPMIKQHLAKHSGTHVIFAAALQYGHSASKRPVGIWYRLWKGVTAEVTYGYFSNLQLTLGLQG